MAHPAPAYCGDHHPHTRSLHENQCTSDGRTLIINTAQILPKTTRSTQGVGVMSLKKGRKVVRAEPLKDTAIQNVSRYRVRSLPAAGALLKPEDRVEQQLSMLED